MTRPKRRALGLLVGIAALAAALVFTVGASGAGKIQIAVFYYNPSPYGVASYKAAQIEAAKLGVGVTIFDANNDPVAQNQQMTAAITSGKYQGFWVWALNGVAEAPVIKMAEAHHIKVATADYTLGTLQQTAHLSYTPGLVTTVGGSLSKQTVAFETLIRLACAKQVGAGAPCNVAFMPGLANYPTDTLREQDMSAVFASGPIHLTYTPPGEYDQPTSQSVALTYFQSKPNIQVFASFGDQMTAGAITALDQLGITPGKDIQMIGSGGTNQIDAEIKSGEVFGTVALYPCTESYIGIADLVAAIHGKKVPGIVNVIDKNHPLVIDAATLKSTPGYKPDWSLTGAPG
jgi:ribose transport system substrate-binding protein